MLIYTYYFVFRPIKYKSYKKFDFSIELPIIIFISYSIILFLPLLYRNIKFSNNLSEFNNLWVQLKFLKASDLNPKTYINFNYWTGILTLLTIISNYLFIKLILNTRKNIKLLYNIVFILYNLLALYSLINIFSNKISNSYFLVNPNHLAMFISVPIPIIFYFYFIKKENKNKDISLNIIKALHILVLISIIYLTNGRTAIISIFILMLVYTIIERKRVNKKYILLILSLILIISVIIFINKGIVDSQIIITKQITSSVSLKLREEILINSFSIFKDNCLFGIGPGQFPIIYPYHSNGKELVFIHHAHNDYIQFLVEYGMIGVLIMFFLYYKMIIFIKYGLKNLKDNSYHLFLATIFSILIFHFEIFTSFESHIGILFQILIFLVASLYIIVYNFDKYYKSNSDELL